MFNFHSSVSLFRSLAAFRSLELLNVEKRLGLHPLLHILLIPELEKHLAQHEQWRSQKRLTSKEVGGGGRGQVTIA